jgi:pimeloyl-ACP methyl ester carboxylesterase
MASPPPVREPKEGSAVSLTAIPQSRPFPRVEGVEHRFVQARGIRFHLAEAGAADPVVTPKLLQGGDRYASDLRVRTVPGAGHLLPEERPDLVASAVRELFQTT